MNCAYLFQVSVSLIVIKSSDKNSLRERRLIWPTTPCCRGWWLEVEMCPPTHRFNTWSTVGGAVGEVAQSIEVYQSG